MSNEPRKIPVNYAEASGTLIKVPGLKSSPVTITFATGIEEIPAGMEERDKTIRHCSMVNPYFRRGKYDSAAACRRTIDRVPHRGTGDTCATLYAPLDKTPFTPHVIMIVTTPRNMLKRVQSTHSRPGRRIHAEFSGIQSVCSDATAWTCLTGLPNFSSGVMVPGNSPVLPMTRW